MRKKKREIKKEDSGQRDQNPLSGVIERIEFLGNISYDNQIMLRSRKTVINLGDEKTH